MLYDTLLDRIPAQFRSAARALALAFAEHTTSSGGLNVTPELQRAGEDWHAVLAAARAWAALQGARTLHVSTTTRDRDEPEQFAASPARVNVSTFFSLPFDKALDAFYTRHAEILIDAGDLWELYWERGVPLAEASAAEFRAVLLRDLGESLESGESMRGWKERMSLEHGATESYLETVWRTNVAQAYSDGQRAQAAEYPDVILFRRVATMDTTTRPNHRAAHGLFWRKDDPRADMLAAPWGFNCRCSDVPVTRARAKRYGVEFDEGGDPVLPLWPDSAHPDEGFK